jgi:flagellar hook-basal body complex protein FliE
MQIREFSKPVTAAKLNESLAKRFGSKINIDAFTTEQLQDARNKLRTKVFNVETMESFDAVQKTEYSKNKMFLDVLNAALSERDDVSIAIDEAIESLNEGEEDKAELVMAAKDMVDRVTGWMEDTAEMQTESMLELADAIRDEMGSESAEAFTNSVKPALEALYDVMETTRQALTQGVGMLTGEAEPMDTMGAEEPGMDDMDMEPTVDGDDDIDMDMEGDDDFGAADAAAGGAELGGREKRESVQHSKKKLK